MPTTNPGTFPPQHEPIDFRNAVARFDVPEEFAHERFAHINGGHYDIAALVQANGRFYIAAEIANNIIGRGFHGQYHPYNGDVLRYGPGGRRHYYEVNEALVNGFIASADGILNISYRKADHLAPRARKIHAFALAIIDYITAN